MKLIFWPLKWMKVLPFLAVSGAMIFAGLTQWAGSWSWVEMIAHFRVYVLLACLLGSLLFLIGLSLARVVLGLAISVWLAWPMLPYFVPPDKPAPAAAAEGANLPTPPEITIAVFNMHYLNQSLGLMEKVLSWDADLVILAEVTREFYRDHFQMVREAYAESWMGVDERTHGIWCFSRLPIVRDFCQTRTKATGLATCDWTLKLGEKDQFRWIALHVPPPLKEGEDVARRKALAAAAEALGAHEGARILAGDLNCTPFSNLFQSVLASGRVRDSALGHGLSMTWSPFPLVGLPLDHVLISDHWEVVARGVGDFHGSDHRPLLVKLRKIR